MITLALFENQALLNVLSEALTLVSKGADTQEWRAEWQAAIRSLRAKAKSVPRLAT